MLTLEACTAPVHYLQILIIISVGLRSWGVQRVKVPFEQKLLEVTSTNHSAVRSP